MLSSLCPLEWSPKLYVYPTSPHPPSLALFVQSHISLPSLAKLWFPWPFLSPVRPLDMLFQLCLENSLPQLPKASVKNILFPVGPSLTTRQPLPINNRLNPALHAPITPCTFALVTLSYMSGLDWKHHEDRIFFRLVHIRTLVRSTRPGT